MNTFKLESGDILVNVNRRRDPLSTIKRWAAGPYEHVFMYIGRVRLLVNPRQGIILRVPLLFESDGDGVVLESLSSRYDQEVVVLRLKPEHYRRKIPRVLVEATKLADDPQSHYDYLCLVKHVLPRLICEKLRLPTWILQHLPLAWQRDARQICSEAVFEIFHKAGVVEILFDHCQPPMPGDFVTDSPLLEEVWRGILSQDLIPLEGHTEE